LIVQSLGFFIFIKNNDNDNDIDININKKFSSIEEILFNLIFEKFEKFDNDNDNDNVNFLKNFIRICKVIGKFINDNNENLENFFIYFIEKFSKNLEIFEYIKIKFYMIFVENER